MILEAIEELRATIGGDDDMYSRDKEYDTDEGDGISLLFRAATPLSFRQVLFHFSPSRQETHRAPGAQLDQQLAAGKTSMREIWKASWNINATGTSILAATFIPLLIQSRNPRLLFLASGTSTLSGTEIINLAVNHYPRKRWPKSAFDVAAYRSVKASMNVMMREWYRMLHEDGVKVWCVSPGFLATGFGGDPEALKKVDAQDPVLAGAFVKSVLEGERDGDVGKGILKDGVQPW